MEINYRLVQEGDAGELARMRWDFQLIGREEHAGSEEEFMEFCEKFFRESLESGDWRHFVAEVDGKVIAHVAKGHQHQNL